MSAPLLSHDVLLTVFTAAVRSGLGQHRGGLLAGIDMRLIASMPMAPSQSTQLLSDLGTLNHIDILADGTVPLTTWLQNAIQLAGPRLEADTFLDALAKISRGAKTADGSGETKRASAAPDTGWSGVRCFLAYHHADARFAEGLRKHLSPLMRNAQLSLWDMNQITVGASIGEAMRAHLDTADLALLLVSADFLASDDLDSEVVQPALARRDQGLKIVPILVRPCAFWGSPLGYLQPLPSTGEPITSFHSTDLAFTDIARSISEIIKLRAMPHGLGGRASQTPPHTRRNISPPHELPDVVLTLTGLSATAARPPERPRSIWPIEEIFQLSGLPEATYVEPEQLPRIATELSRMGRGLVIEGPSGIGKTTAVRKALGGSSRAKWLHGLKKKDAIELDQILDEEAIEGHLILDDFHRLTGERKERVANYIKILADDSQPHAKITVIGVSDARQPLFSENSNLTGRISVIRFGRQPDKKILELLSKGEEVANIRFTNRDELIRAARGSFIVAQQLCLEAARQAGIMRTQPNTKSINVLMGVVVREVVELLRAAFDRVILDFVASDSQESWRCVCFTLLWLLAESDGGSVRVDEVGYRAIDLRDAMRQFDRDDLKRRAGSSGIDRYVFAEADVLSIEDPQFTFYLQHLDRIDGWTTLADRAGIPFVGIIDGQPRFATRKVDDASAIGSPLHFLDIQPFPFWHKSADSLFQMLCDAYPESRHAQMLAEAAGIDVADWNRAGSPHEFWHSLLETAQRQKMLRALLDAVLNDKTRMAYHGPIKNLINLPG